MAGKRRRRNAGARPRSAGRVRAGSYRVRESSIAAARAILGTDTATATIEMALDMVVSRKELVDGAAAMLGVTIWPFGDEA